MLCTSSTIGSAQRRVLVTHETVLSATPFCGPTSDRMSFDISTALKNIIKRPATVPPIFRFPQKPLLAEVLATHPQLCLCTQSAQRTVCASQCPLRTFERFAARVCFIFPLLALSKMACVIVAFSYAKLRLVISRVQVSALHRVTCSALLSSVLGFAHHSLDITAMPCFVFSS